MWIIHLDSLPPQSFKKLAKAVWFANKARNNCLVIYRKRISFELPMTMNKADIMKKFLEIEERFGS